MTGTAMTEASEFDKIYKLGVVPIPTNQPMVRIDQPDLVYRTEEAKYDAVVDDIAERHQKGQPVLVGTVSVEKSELLSGPAEAQGHPAHRAERQAARRRGARSSRSPATRARSRSPPTWPAAAPTSCSAARSSSWPTRSCAARASTRSRTPTTTRRPGPRCVERIKAQVAAEHDEVKDAGGLYVVGTERHESRRIDNQLRGRSGRQGDPGESRFYLSLQDDLMRLFKSDWVDWVLTTLKVPDDVADREQAGHRRDRLRAGARSSAQNFETRKNVLKYDDVMSRQREVIYGERRAVLEGADLHEQIREHDRRDRRGLRHRRHRGLPGGVGPRARCGRRSSSSTRSSLTLRRGRGRGRWPRRADPRVADRGPPGRRAGGVRRARGRSSATEVMRELERRVLLVGARPQVARAPLRDGLPARGHRAARLLPARPARRVPARGLRHVPGDDGRRSRRRPSASSSTSRSRSRSEVEDRHAHTLEEHVEVGPALAQAAASSHDGDHPAIRAKGLEAPEAAAEPHLLRPVGGRRAPRWSGLRRPTAADDALRRRQPQRRVPVRLRQEVQEVPRRAGRAHRPHHAGQRLTGVAAFAWTGDTARDTAPLGLAA